MPLAPSVAVIGGGISGPVTAIALAEAGIPATVFEAAPGPDGTPAGLIALAPNGVAALDAVGAASAVLDHAQPIAHSVVAVGRKRIPMPALADVPPLQVVRRGDLHRALHDIAVARGIPFEYGKRLVGATPSIGGVTATFADGTSVRADVLVGADGVHSGVRRIIDPAAPAAGYTGLLAFEGRTDLDVPGGADTMTFAFGRRAYYLYWGLPGGGSVWGANLPSPEPLSRRKAQERPKAEWLKVLADTYAGDDPGAELVARTRPEDLQVTGALYIMPPVPHWHRDGMVLVGDAAHAPSNSSGQGASLSIESAVELARCLRDRPDAASAFATYEQLRRARVEGVAARAAKINHVKAPGPVARAALPVLMPLVARYLMRPERTLGPEQRFRIDWAAPVA
ncbi:FAD-dependent oxidoreductase [Pseudonocardia sp. CA-107938]|uniref:FAD-dependent oxidoreductase n=1 Tax=Pseudonocardia sp. CA-107938 TaxID=3240021 RepID=UPI003D919F99